MQIETDNRAQDLGPGDVDGRVGAVEHTGHRVVLRRGDQHRTHPPVRSQQCLDDERRFGDEEALIGLDPTAELRIRQPDVIGQSGIVRVVDRDHGHVGTVQAISAGSKKPRKNLARMPASSLASCNDAPANSSPSMEDLLWH